MNQPYVLILYFSQLGNTEKMAEYIAKGAEYSGHFQTTLLKIDHYLEPIHHKATIQHHLDLLKGCAGLALGSPTYFGNMAAPMKSFWDQTTPLWLEGALVDKPACVFTSTGGPYGGSETTLLSMMLPLLHHGMTLCGIPYCKTTYAPDNAQGMPYGVSHLAESDGSRPLDHNEKKGCMILGKRLAHVTQCLSSA